MTSAIFTRRWIGMLILLALLIAVSPGIVDLLVRNSSCFGSDSACRDMAAVYAHYGRSLILIVVLIPLCVTIAARTLAIGVFAWAFPFALLMLAGALPLLHSAGPPANPDVVAEALAEPGTMPLLFFVVLLLALSAHPDDENRMAAAWRTVLGFVAVATVFVTAPAWLVGFASLPALGQFSVPIAVNFARAHAALGITHELAQIAYGCMIAFIVATGGLVFSDSRGGGGFARA